MSGQDRSSKEGWSEILRGFVAEVGSSLAGALKWAFVFAAIGIAIFIADLATQSTDEHGNTAGGVIAWLGSITKGEFGPDGFSFERQVQKEQTRQLAERAEQIDALELELAELRQQVAAISIESLMAAGEPAAGPSEPSGSEPDTGTDGGRGPASLPQPPVPATIRFPEQKSVSDADVRLQELQIAQNIASPLKAGSLQCGTIDMDGAVIAPPMLARMDGTFVHNPDDIVAGENYRLLENKLLKHVGHSGQVAEVAQASKTLIFSHSLRALPANTRVTTLTRPILLLLPFAKGESLSACYVDVRLDYVPALTDLNLREQRTAN